MLDSVAAPPTAEGGSPSSRGTYSMFTSMCSVYVCVVEQSQQEAEEVISFK